MKKSIIYMCILTLFLMIPMVMSDIVRLPESNQTNYSYSQFEFGNSVFIQGANTNVALGGNLLTYCQPFTAGESGNMTEINAYGINTGALQAEFCISPEYTYPWDCQDNESNAYRGNLSNRWFGTPENISLNVTQGEIYYLCIGSQDTGISVYTYEVNSLDAEELQYMRSTISITNTTYPDRTQDDMYVWYHSTIVPWAQRTRVFRGIQYCYENGNCYLFQPRVGGTFTLNNPVGGDMIGQIFNYPYDYASIVNATFMLARGASTSGGELWHVEIHEWNWTTNTSVSIYNSSLHTLDDINNTLEWEKVTVEFNGTLPILHPGRDYLAGVRCTSGCTGDLADRLHLHKWGQPSSSSWYGSYQGMLYNEYYINPLEPDYDGFFILGMNETLWSDCTPEWYCTSYGACQPSNSQACTAVADNKSCGETFTGDMDLFNISCTYSSGGSGGGADWPEEEILPELEQPIEEQAYNIFEEFLLLWQKILREGLTQENLKALFSGWNLLIMLLIFLAIGLLAREARKPKKKSRRRKR